MSERNKIALKKRALLEALEKSLGVVTTACKVVGVSRCTFYEYKQTDPDFAKSVDEIDEIVLDFAESSLHKQINEKNTAATIFYLKTRGRRRGYIERKEIDHSATDGTFLGQTIDPKKLSTEALLELKNAKLTDSKTDAE